MQKTIERPAVDLPQDLTECHVLIHKQSNEISYLKHELSQLKRMIFGQKSEKLVTPPAEQTSLEELFESGAPEPGFAKDTRL